MFFLKKLEHPIPLHPSYFGPSLADFIEQKLRDDVEGTCSGENGYIVKVLRIDSIGDGVVLPGEGLAQFNSVYQALVLRPFKGQVVDAIVSNVNKLGFFAQMGPLQIFTSAHLLPVAYRFTPDANPAEFSPVGEGAQGTSVVKGRKVRLRIIGVRLDATEIFAIGTMKEDFLGPFD
ncbi:hypothetical protein BCV69DRAFT_169296 [Microstroma glucosiphilum]|uniref:Uncharacterized protein n=1 Tax=Pseudomicrostroma glucosiphilum TaxID=1684307 RepID=A0A316U856_9BASI|nr:hypothetical protein BCV69DRAFT_169296 [Pseudomicrostroma glucosiphilum]PWN21396.1 hypothetical protein BCV69DRAFT_169296 [Pseudomicrostroma glucosiphilum]